MEETLDSIQDFEGKQMALEKKQLLNLKTS